MFLSGYAGWTKGHRWALRNQDTQEGHYHSGENLENVKNWKKIKDGGFHEAQRLVIFSSCIFTCRQSFVEFGSIFLR